MAEEEGEEGRCLLEASVRGARNCSIARALNALPPVGGPRREEFLVLCKGEAGEHYGGE